MLENRLERLWQIALRFRQANSSLGDDSEVTR